MEQVDFYELSRVVQDRFVSSTRGTDVPAPILRAPGTGDKWPAIWLVVSAAAAVGFVGAITRGFGDLSSGLSIQSPVIAGVEVALAVVVVLGIVQAFARWARVKAWPFRPGVYVFAASLIDARSNKLRVAPIEELGVEDGSTIRVKLANGETYSFPRPSGDAAKELSDAKIELAELGPRADPSARIRLDPLFEPRFSSPLGPKHPFKLSLPPWVRARYAVAVLVGAVIGGGAWFVRNTKSDDKMYDVAKKKDDVASYKAYLVHGKRHLNEIANELLPRAELKVAIAAGTVDAIESYIAAHPGTKIGDEVETALRTAMLAELDKAKQAGTLAALDAFAKAHPEHHLEPELAAAVHAVYVAALDKYKTMTPPKDSADELAFMTKLLAWSEKKGPNVDVRFRFAPSKNLKTVDKMVGKNSQFNGEQSYPSKYFEADDMRPREDETGKSIADRFDLAFAPELLNVGLGAAFPDADAFDTPPPQVTVPTLIVTHTEESNGTAFESRTPRGIFVGIQVTFDAQFFIPGDPKPYKLRFTSVRQVSPSQLKELGKDYPPKVPPEKTIYETMAKEAFEQFRDKLLGSFFQYQPK
jgi:hypothetical protein